MRLCLFYFVSFCHCSFQSRTESFSCFAGRKLLCFWHFSLLWVTRLQWNPPGKGKKAFFTFSSGSPTIFFNSKYSIYVLVLLDKIPMMEFFTLLTKLIKFFSKNWKENLIRFIIKATLWLNQLNLKRASSNRARLTLTVKVFFNECQAVCCSLPSKSCKVSAVFVLFWCCFFAFVLKLVNVWPCVCVCVGIGSGLGRGRAPEVGMLRLTRVPSLNGWFAQSASLSLRSAPAAGALDGEREHKRDTVVMAQKNNCKFWLCFSFIPQSVIRALMYLITGRHCSSSNMTLCRWNATAVV